MTSRLVMSWILRPFQVGIDVAADVDQYGRIVRGGAKTEESEPSRAKLPRGYSSWRDAQ